MITLARLKSTVLAAFVSVIALAFSLFVTAQPDLHPKVLTVSLAQLDYVPKVSKRRLVPPAADLKPSEIKPLNTYDIQHSDAFDFRNEETSIESFLAVTALFLPFALITAFSVAFSRGRKLSKRNINMVNYYNHTN